jgi:hypothetical protein
VDGLDAGEENEGMVLLGGGKDGMLGALVPGVCGARKRL